MPLRDFYINTYNNIPQQGAAPCDRQQPYTTTPQQQPLSIVTSISQPQRG